MPKTIALICLCVLGGVALGALLLAPPATTVPSTMNESTASRLDALEAALNNEREARQLLEDELFRLLDQREMQGLPAGAPPVIESPETQVVATETPQEDRRSRQAGSRPENRAEQLAAAGFTEDRASYIARREAELRMQAMQARFDATQSGDAFDFRSNALSADRALRDDLGELEYLQYLEASNRPTAVAVSSVMELSPAEAAGLQRGDQILRYNGERVYNTYELNQLQLGATAGTNITVDIMRDGVPMQISLPSGPLGIQAGRGRRR